MIDTSPQYKQAVKQGTRTTTAKITFGVYDVTSKDDATPSASTTQPFTSVNAVKGDIRQPDYRMGTFEDNELILDGSFYLKPDDANPSSDILGWWSGLMSGEDRSFAAQRPLSFDGVATKVSIPRGNYPIGNTVTVEAWIKVNKFQSRDVIFTTRVSNTAGCWQLEIGSGSGTGSGGYGRVLATGIGTFIVESVDNTIKLGEWTHIAFTKSGNIAKLYVNGKEVVYNTTVSNPNYVLADNTDPIMLGAGANGQDLMQQYNGTMKEVRLWNRALTQAQIQNSMENTLLGTELGLMGYWKLYKDVGNTVIDFSPNALLGIATAATWEDASPVITMNFSQPHSSKGIGLFFGSEDYCTDFEVTWYDGANILAYEYVVDSQRQEVTVDKPIDNFNKIVIKLLKTRKPYRYARIMEIGFGLEASFDDSELVSASLIEEVDPSSVVLSINTLKFTVLNTDQQFNMLNPEGIFKYLQRRQKITASSGIMTEQGTYEFVPLGIYYLSDWKNSTGLTASLEATDAIGLLDKTPYRSSKFWVNEPVENVLRHILADAGQFAMIISASAALERVTGYIPPMSHREALGTVLLASGNVLRVERSGILSVMKISYSGILASIDYHTMLGSPTIEQKQLITSVEVKDYGYVLSPTVTELNKSSFNVTGTQKVVIEYGKAASNVSISVNEGVGHINNYDAPPATANMINMSASMVNGYLRLVSTALDPMIYEFNAFNIDPNVYRYIVMRYRIVSVSGQSPGIWQMLFLQENSPTVTVERILNSSPLKADGEWHEAVIDAWANPNWRTSRVTGWRFDWVEVGGIVMDLDYVKVTNSLYSVDRVSAVSAELTITAEKEVTVIVSGKEYIESTRTVSASVPVPSGELPQTATVSDNKLISGNGQAVASRLLEYYQRRIKQSFNFSDNPAIQAGDYVDVATMFGQPYSGIVEHQEITFSPSLIGKLEVTG